MLGISRQDKSGKDRIRGSRLDDVKGVSHKYTPTHRRFVIIRILLGLVLE